MHLKTLEIQGFKSFPERTVIDFHPGVTAIIGPNGSGKSNVTDAIRWVLGEQSVKTLRGARMEDVIFTGTQSRRAMSYAEVSITFDNSDQGLAVEYTELQVTRRLYRSGDSEYFLNKTACRLKDITTLFMDTGLGRDGYSIVGQGRVDEILSHRSEDRRRIFEEASGIVKFKTRKEESERKLLQTEQNLIRINDIINELKERIEPLGQQAETAKQFLQLSESLRTLEIALILDTIEQNEVNITQANTEKDLVDQDLMSEQDKLAVLRDDHRTATESIRMIEQQIESHRTNFNQLNSLMGVLTSQKAANNERADQMRRRIAQTGDIQQDLLNQIAILESDRSAREKKADILRRQQTHFENQLVEAESHMRAILEQLSTAEVQIEAQKGELEVKTEAIYEQRNRIGQLKSQLPMIEQRKKTLVTDIQTQISDLDRLNIQHEETLENFNRVKIAFSQQEKAKANIQALIEKSRTLMQEDQQKIEAILQKTRNDQYRLQTLSELERNHEGYADSVRRLMQQGESDVNFKQGIIGTLGELITVDPQFELAIEIALGPALSNIITDNETTASRLITYLKENRAGRATFLPIATIKGRRLENSLVNQVDKMPGYLGIACDLVAADSSLRAILESLLGRIVIAESLSQANAMARKTQYNCRIVTLEGDVVNPGGSLTGGFNRKGSSGVLGRAREIEALKIRIVEQETESASISQQQHQAEIELQNHARQLSTLEHQMLQLSHQKIRDEAQLATVEGQITQSGHLRLRLDAEFLSLQQQSDGLKSQMTELDQLIVTEDNQLANLRAYIAQQEGANKAEQQRRDDLREEISDLRVSMHSITESLQASVEILDRITSERVGIEDRKTRGLAETVEFQSEIERLTVETESIEDQIRHTHLQSGDLAESVRKLNEEREALETQQGRFFDTLETQASRISTLQAEMGRVQGRLERFELAGDEAKNRLWETYELTAQDASQWRQPIENRQETVRKVSTLRNSIKNLGAVNLAAIDEYSTVNERYEFMGKQRDDIEDSRHKLQNVITELTDAMQRQFTEHFQLINENFKAVFAELFGGGMAELHLENPDEVLSCGIEIKAQPPGKKLQSLLLLSGGERCLTAIALLFAILKLRPTPFCVLDEVEAALDDANVVRFSEYIRHYAEESQFILVTHRKGTMESADRLYGVTMQERGISRILSMQLAE
ncbi:MAG: chromosome segregation protein SMC [Eubacteriales bacterium]|nr:chromosome segregation protein SMC [Eubacteriales bacterium]